MKVCFNDGSTFECVSVKIIESNLICDDIYFFALDDVAEIVDTGL